MHELILYFWSSSLVANCDGVTHDQPTSAELFVDSPRGFEGDSQKTELMSLYQYDSLLRIFTLTPLLRANDGGLGSGISPSASGASGGGGEVGTNSECEMRRLGALKGWRCFMTKSGPHPFII